MILPIAPKGTFRRMSFTMVGVLLFISYLLFHNKPLIVGIPVVPFPRFIRATDVRKAELARRGWGPGSVRSRSGRQ